MKKLAKVKGVEIHGIAWNDRAERITPWLAKHGNPYTKVWMDHSGRAALTAGIRGIPESYLVDGTGRVRLHVRGAISPVQAARISAILKELQQPEGGDAAHP